MAIRRLLPIAGKIYGLVYRVPVLGELAVRGASRALGSLAVRAPLLGAAPGQHLGQIKDAVLRFFGLVGLDVRVLEVGDGFFEYSVAECPYGFGDASDHDVCDACMDLDRLYVRSLRGRFEIVERLTEGAHRCRFRVSYP